MRTLATTALLALLAGCAVITPAPASDPGPWLEGVARPEPVAPAVFAYDEPPELPPDVELVTRPVGAPDGLLPPALSREPVPPPYWTNQGNDYGRDRDSRPVYSLPIPGFGCGSFLDQ